MADQIGFLPKFKVNRPLTRQEKNDRLDQHVKIDKRLFDNFSVIELNSTYLETTDKWYGMRGGLAFFSMFAVLLCGGLWCSTVGTDIFNTLFNPAWVSKADMADAWVAVSIFCFLGMLPFLWLASFELFKWTHYPLRFNRKTRMVYVFRLDGTVLSVPWDKVHFNLGLGSTMHGQTWDIRGHVLDKEGIIRETLVLGISDREGGNVLGHWELVRRYMEEGPQAVTEAVKCCMPVSKKKEPFLKGYRRFFVVAELMGRTLMIIFFPVLILIYGLGFGVALGRALAMRTSKIPQWPEEVLKVCKIDKNDRYIKNNDTNPF